MTFSDLSQGGGRRRALIFLLNSDDRGHSEFGHLVAEMEIDDYKSPNSNAFINFVLDCKPTSGRYLVTSEQYGRPTAIIYTVQYPEAIIYSGDRNPRYIGGQFGRGAYADQANPEYVMINNHHVEHVPELKQE
jgi:hypothetical protein